MTLTTTLLYQQGALFTSLAVQSNEENNYSNLSTDDLVSATTHPSLLTGTPILPRLGRCRPSQGTHQSEQLDPITLVDINHSINEVINWTSINQSLYDSGNDFCYVTREDGIQLDINQGQRRLSLDLSTRIRSLTNLGDALREYETNTPSQN